MAEVGEPTVCTFRRDARVGGSEREAENSEAERIGIFSRTAFSGRSVFVQCRWTTNKHACRMTESASTVTIAQPIDTKDRQAKGGFEGRGRGGP